MAVVFIKTVIGSKGVGFESPSPQITCLCLTQDIAVLGHLDDDIGILCKQRPLSHRIISCASDGLHEASIVPVTFLEGAA